MMNPVQVIGFVCENPMRNPRMKTAADLLAAIHGICAGFGDPKGEKCLGDFPNYVQSSLSEYTAELWYVTLAKLCAGKSLDEACDAILKLICDWHQANGLVFSVIRLPVTKDWRAALEPSAARLLDAEVRNDRLYKSATLNLMEAALRNSSVFVPAPSTLGEMLALLYGIRLSRYQPHGHFDGIGALNTYVRQFFHRHNSSGHMDKVLLEELGDRPFREACLVFADLIARWRASVEL